MLVEMKIKGLMIDPLTQMPIVILRDPDGESVLPIWVGIFEANAIALQMEKIQTPRPMTHDLLKSLMSSMGVALEKIVITELKDNTFYALLHLQHAGKAMTVDSRPSDAIAIALRTQSPIFVDSSVIEKAKTVDLTKEAGDTERLRKWLENIDPDDLGKVM